MELVEEIQSKDENEKASTAAFPHDWTLRSIGEILDFKNGLNKESKYFGYGTPIVNYMDVYQNSGITIDRLTGRVFLNSEEIKNFSAKKGDVFFTRTSETQEEIGIAAVLLDEVKSCVFSGFLLRGRSKNNLLDLAFKKYCFSSEYIRKQIISSSSYTTRALTNGRYLSEVKIAIPPTLTEQKAIAEALSDVDELIASLDKLIKKKKAIKQGAMQQLLTPPHKGGKRLPGFKGEWVEKQLKELISNFIVPMRDKPKEFKGTTPWCRIEDFTGKYLKDSLSGQYVNNLTIEKMNLKVHPINTVLVSCSANLGRCAIVKRPLITNQTFIGLVCNSKKLSNEFLFYYMTFYAHLLNKESSGTTISYMSREQFEEFEIILPCRLDEQIKIASILHDIDIDIELISNKKQKYQQIKQGMMQELLTGKTRLI